MSDLRVLIVEETKNHIEDLKKQELQDKADSAL